VTVTGSDGSVEVSGTAFAAAYGLRSTLFDVTVS
jgi:hypothetical protein